MSDEISSLSDFAPTIVIADGTPYRTEVIDLRGLYQWSFSTGISSRTTERFVILHHTATPSPVWRYVDEILYLVRVASSARYGLPYNFVISEPGSVYYLNDLDRAWPHTLNYNNHSAIALVGNFMVDEPTDMALETYERLVRALRSMWQGQYEITLKSHREMPGNMTQCPGDNLQAKFEEIRSRF